MKFTTEQIKTILANSASNVVLQKGRNLVVKTNFEGKPIVIKAFKVPKKINQIIYKYFRKSKAKRSFEYANKLLEMQIGTPIPISYIEEYNKIGLEESYYISDFQPYDLTYRELVEDPNYPNHEDILRQFTYFCFQLHEKGIIFKDHSPGNTLIQKNDSEYEYFLVDLNRMKFKNKISFQERMYNMRRLTPKKEMVKIMADEYAKWYDAPYDKIFDTLWSYTEQFQKRYQRRQNFKKALRSK